MKLMNKTLEARFAKVGRQDVGRKEDTPVVVAKFFSPVGSATWWATEYDPKTREFFGYVDLFGAGRAGGAEWGYFSLDELQTLKLPFGMGVERDLHWKERKASEIPGMWP